jgi:hypothetical protein
MDWVLYYNIIENSMPSFLIDASLFQVEESIYLEQDNFLHKFPAA